MSLGKKIKSLRVEKDLTQLQLADLLNLSKANISKYESDIVEPNIETLKMLSNIFDVSVDYLIGKNIDNNEHSSSMKKNKKGIKIPVIGRVVAGIPVDAIEEIIDYEEITEEMAKNGEYFGLIIKGDSMSPRMQEGDVIIVRQQPDVESGDIAVVLVDGDCATVKKVLKSDIGITLVAYNPASYPPRFYSNEDIQNLPVTILGKAVELRGKL